MSLFKHIVSMVTHCVYMPDTPIFKMTSLDDKIISFMRHITYYNSVCSNTVCSNTVCVCMRL